jgi:glycosyltransferase involved in cell wall biosynthesis
LQISIIIPTQNEYSNIVRLLGFFEKALHHETSEIIIVDSGSSNDQVELISGPFKYIKTNVTSRAWQMNEGAKISTGNVLVFLHADVTPPSTFESDILSAIDAGNEFGFFAYDFDPSSFWLDINASFTGKKGLFVGGGDQMHFIKKSIFDTLGGYDENMVVMEDFEFFKRIIINKIPYIILQNRAQVSSRKYIKNSWLKVNFANLIAFIMFKLNFDSKTIKKYYTKLLNK